jgi:hypothetical protein
VAKRRVQPKFFLFVTIVIAVVAGVIVVANKLGEEKTSAQLPESTVSPVETPVPGATPTPAPPLPDGLSVQAGAETDPALFGFSYKIAVKRNEVSSYMREEPISFSTGEAYADVKGVLTFGGNNYRNTFSCGTAPIVEKQMRRTWEQSIGGLGNWTGTGWTGQPLIVQWSDEVRPLLGVAEEFRQMQGFTEVIYPAMDGKIYFFELETGTKTRNPINVGAVIKSTPCLDPRGWPVLYVGQSIQSVNENNLPVAYIYAYSLISNEELARFGGHDYFSEREWQAYDSSPLIVDDTLVYGGENGVLYTAKLNTTFDAAAGTVAIAPESLVKYSYTGTGYTKTDAAGSRWYGIESSVSGFRNYVYFADNGGRLQCVDLNTMQLQFVADLSEDADATVVIDESYEDNTFYLYAASQVKTATAGSEYGYSYHRCFDGRTGALKWEEKWLASTGDSNNGGGTLATPQVGRGNVSHLVYYSMNLVALTGSNAQQTPAAASADEAQATPAEQSAGTQYALGGRIVAYDKRRGEVVWSIEQSADYWSSPVLVYDELGKGYLIQCDRSGFVKLYDALTGAELFSIDLGSRIDSTPAVFDQYLVVGTRGKGGAGDAAKIVCIKIN